VDPNESSWKIPVVGADKPRASRLALLAFGLAVGFVYGFAAGLFIAWLVSRD